MSENLLKTIRRAIETSDKTRYRLSKESGIDQGRLSRFVNGETGLTVEAVEKLADVLGLEIIIRPKRRKAKR